MLWLYLKVPWDVCEITGHEGWQIDPPWSIIKLQRAASTKTFSKGVQAFHWCGLSDHIESVTHFKGKPFMFPLIVIIIIIAFLIRHLEATDICEISNLPANTDVLYTREVKAVLRERSWRKHLFYESSSEIYHLCWLFPWVKTSMLHLQYRCITHFSFKGGNENWWKLILNCSQADLTEVTKAFTQEQWRKWTQTKATKRPIHQEKYFLIKHHWSMFRTLTLIFPPADSTLFQNA